MCTSGRFLISSCFSGSLSAHETFLPAERVIWANCCKSFEEVSAKSAGSLSAFRVLQEKEDFAEFRQNWLGSAERRPCKHLPKFDKIHTAYSALNPQKQRFFHVMTQKTLCSAERKLFGTFPKLRQKTESEPHGQITQALEN